MPRPPKTKALDEALEKPHTARQNFVQACADMLAQRDFRAVEQALATWRQSAEAVQKEADVVYDDAQVYGDNHSAHWQAAEHGQACATWMGELELLTDFDGTPTDEVRMAVELSGSRPRADLEGDPSAPVPALPEMPVLGSESVSAQTHHIDLRYTKAELLLIFDQAIKEDVDRGGHYDCRGGAIHIWSHPWTTAATRYDSATIGALYVNWLEERIDRIETDESFDLADLLHELAILEDKALGETKHGVYRW